jgi:TPR repeat protein
MFYYAECLRLGEGIPTNTIEALTWYHRAATNNETRAIKYLKSLEEKILSTN